MTNTPNLGLPVVSASQGQMYLPHNAALDQIDALIQPSVISMDQTAPPASPSAGDRYIVAGGATGAWVGWEDSIAVFLLTGGWQRLTPKAGWQAWVASASQQFSFGAAWSAMIGEAPKDGKVYARKDGAWVEVSASGGMYDFGLAFGGTPLTSEVMAKLTLPREVNLVADFAGSFGHVGVNPTAVFVIDVLDDAVSIGTISIATDGSFTFASSGGVATTIAAGSLIVFSAQVAVDATITDITFTLAGDV